MLKDYFEVPNKPAIKSGNVLSCDFTDHETFIPQPLDFTRNTSATYVDCNGIIAEAAIDVPRIDYLTEIGKAKELQKPSLLLEPQSTNKFTRSEDFSNSYWAKSNCTVQQSTITSPDGLQSSYKLIPDAGTGGNRSLGRSLTSLSNFHTFSVFAKAGEYKYAILRNRNSPSAVVSFDLENGTFNVNQSTAVYVADSAKMENYGNGWYRCSITLDPSQANTVGQLFSSVSVGITGNEINNFDGDGTSGIYVFGAQLEEQNYVTSYIPTSGSTVTRNGEVCNNAGQLGVFNNTEGVLYAEIAALADDLTFRSISINNGTDDECVIIRYRTNTNRINGLIRDGGSAVNNINYDIVDITEYHKIAFKYKTGDCALWIDGQEVATGTSAFTLSTLTNLSFDKGNGGDDFYGKVKEVKAFRRALTDSELTELTNNIT